METPFEPVRASDIQSAQARISAVIAPTPLQYCQRLSVLTGAEVFLKREDLQDVRSYKIRGAYNAISQLSSTQRQAGIVAASAGNHAQGVAYACRSLGIEGRIYVPAPTPRQKLDRIRTHGGDAIQLIVGGDTFDEANAAAHADAERTGATVVEPFGARDTVVGQGTVAAEILAQLTTKGKRPDAVVVPVGGGLLAGVVSYLADMAPQTAAIGVEPAGAASMNAAVEAGHPVTLASTDTFIDGAAVAKAGELTYSIIRCAGDQVRLATAPEGAVCTEMLDLYQNEGIIAEPAGALSVAGLAGGAVPPTAGERPVVVCIISGGNNDVLRYAEVVERSLIHRGLKHYFLVDFPQEPGQLRNFVTDVLGPDDDIVRFEYLKRNNRTVGTALVGLELVHQSDIDPLLARMDESPIRCQRLVPGSPEYSYLV